MRVSKPQCKELKRYEDLLKLSDKYGVRKLKIKGIEFEKEILQTHVAQKENVEPMTGDKARAIEKQRMSMSYDGG